ncbi:hypothetical protein GOBAR_DD00959 [Gossypium barbadense]|nr:hypothetical protein GOBAR_DD00959 [Gossypium barbadense]
MVNGNCLNILCRCDIDILNQTINHQAIMVSKGTSSVKPARHGIEGGITITFNEDCISILALMSHHLLPNFPYNSPTCRLDREITILRPLHANVSSSASFDGDNMPTIFVTMFLR